MDLLRGWSGMNHYKILDLLVQTVSLMSSVSANANSQQMRFYNAD